MAWKVIGGFLIAMSAGFTLGWIGNGTLGGLPIESASAPRGDGLPVTPFVVGFGTVDIEPGTTPLSAPIVGRVAEVLVQDGQSVEKGQPLIRFESHKAEIQLQLAQLRVEQCMEQLVEANRGPERKRLLVKQQDEAVRAARAQLDAQKKDLERLEGLNRENAISRQQLEAARELLQAMTARLASEEAQLDVIKLEDPEERIRLAELALRAAREDQNLAKQVLEDHTLRAPCNGIVLRVHVTPGQVLTEKQSLPAIWFCPDLPRIVRAEIEQRYALRVRPGVRAEFFDDLSNEPVGKGHVERVSQWITHRRSILDEPLQRNDVRTLECIIEFDTPPAELKIGQRLRVHLDCSMNEL